MEANCIHVDATNAMLQVAPSDGHPWKRISKCQQIINSSLNIKSIRLKPLGSLFKISRILRFREALSNVNLITQLIHYVNKFDQPNF